MDNPTPPVKERFWKRQFSPTVTRRQRIFDVIFGTIAPILLLIFDPIVFRSQACFGNPIFADISIFSYVAIGIGVVVLLVWLFARDLPRTGTGFIAGVLMIGSLFAAIVGLAMLPTSIFGILFFGLGLLGFIPLIVSIVYARNALRALRIATLSPEGNAPPMIAMMIGIVVVLAVPALIHVQLVNIIDSKFQAMVERPEQVQTRVAELVKVRSLCLGLCNAAIDRENYHIISSLTEQRTAVDNAYYAQTGEHFSSYCNTSD